MPKKVAVLLSGCGFLDGAEIHEAVLTLLSLDQFDGVEAAKAGLEALEAVDSGRLEDPANAVEDLLLAAYKPSGGMHVMLGDFTGHGLPAAIGAICRKTCNGISIIRNKPQSLPVAHDLAWRLMASGDL